MAVMAVLGRVRQGPTTVVERAGAAEEAGTLEAAGAAMEAGRAAGVAVAAPVSTGRIREAGAMEQQEWSS
jgi:hypothetical protein